MITTKLDAINSMLRSVGEAPVDNLNAELFQAQEALAVLEEVNRLVQSGDFSFNRDFEVKLTPNTNNEITVPNNVIRIDPSDTKNWGDYNKYTVRSGKIYDRKNHTFTITQPIYFDIQWYFDFDDLPEPAKHFVYIRAARRFQTQRLGAQDLEMFNREDELRALTNLQNYDSEMEDYNIFNDPDTVHINFRYGGRRYL